MSTSRLVHQSYSLAKQRYAALGVNTDKVLKALAKVPVSLHCWQGDDVGGFENFGGELGGGLAGTGNYPGKARTPQKLRANVEHAVKPFTGKHRFNLHAFYAEMIGGKKVERNELTVKHFQG